jgi:transcriptional regulator with XRE-family HTH domain
MSGEELKKYIKRSGLTMSDVARELGTTQQNVQARLGRKTIKIDFIQKIKEIIDRCAPPLPAEMEEAVIGPNVSQSLGSDAALQARVESLEIALFLANLPQKRLKLFLGIVLRAYHVNATKRKFRGKSGKEHKNTPAVKKSSRWGNKW